ncbi:hypothetical protein PISS_a0639 [Pseudoalteromonas issachenkonii]|uniref:Uncharacterized protein n=1 Tax=Pseudoalteromonas issachenkonii TaxID=152297 RepID=A0ABN5C4J8_9GAMM|nr:hypothetical protein PISS_a0639 [Pseudoalteromonas issachenkonii]
MNNARITTPFFSRSLICDFINRKTLCSANKTASACTQYC